MTLMREKTAVAIEEFVTAVVVAIAALQIDLRPGYETATTLSNLKKAANTLTTELANEELEPE